MLITLSLLAALQQPTLARVPGTIRIDGTPDPLPDVEAVVAFPNLRFKDPLYVTYPRDDTDRLCVVERGGTIRIFQNRPDVASSSVLLDLSAKVLRSHDEEGLLGLAFHPAFADNGYLYVMYSAPRPRRNVVSRFTLGDDRVKVDRSSELVLMEIAQPYANHNGGMIEFGPDGYLYLALGDGGAGGDPHQNGQSKSTWLGKILRIDVDRSGDQRNYAVPSDNPFVGDPSARPEIWAYGLRNPWRFSFDRGSGLLIAGDVGQNSYEEIDIIKKGGNYGWNAREGLHAFTDGSGEPPFEEPILEYGRGDGQSVTGGYVYRGNAVPSLQGAYVYGDFQSGTIWALRWDGARVTENRRLAITRTLSSFGEDRHGELYTTAFDGSVRRFAPASAAASVARFPMRLSETGLWVNGKPHPALIPYDVAVPLWSDGAEKERWVMLPGRERITIAAAGEFRFPQGTILVKEFTLDGAKLETRLLVQQQRGWVGYTYVWNDAETDAFLIDGRVDRVAHDHTWTFPSRSDCMSCHTEAAGFVLGFRARQLGAQLERLTRLDCFDQPVTAAPFLASDVRAYLDANCSHCHRPEVPGRAPIDLRADTPLAHTGMVNVDPTHGDLGVRGAKIVKPGDPDASTLYLRMRDTSQRGMPPLAHNVVDQEALERVARWIRAMR